MRLSFNELRWLKRAALDSNRPLESLVQRRINREPLQYIIGTQPFGALDLRVRSPVLIPRPETEDWVIRLAEHLCSSYSSRPISLLDLGTGSGCIPLLLCHLCPNIVATGIDISPNAVQLANENATLCGVPHSRYKASLCDFAHPGFPKAEAINPPYDILTSNPPYITSDEYLQLSDDVANFEDPTALIGGYDGLEFYRLIARLIARDGFLSPEAVVALEVGHSQADAVCDMLNPTGFRTSIWMDPWGKKRTVIAQRR
ncbi:S-adenosyl-L-methionine-dependent methyltransferase [Lentinula aciculospora]|uniref:S-adenosyl-L-methionine-dependent methyltransferase n=1 Tax=Lentinula aciculospora TaxID=153920 RepID=A0A9W9AI81_9AGAR|nr:S-adenosyl-L-methionine-dependent methyltransferase [Lentinula aciculospora]